MLCEGTRLESDSEKNFTEIEVEEKTGSIIKNSDGLVFVYFAMTNVDRFMSFYRATVKNKRILVIDTRLAYIIENLREKISDLPDVRTDENIRVYYKLSKSRTFCEKDYRPFERDFFNNKITFDEINKNQKKYVVHSGFNKLMELIYLQPTDADFIYSSSEHFLEGEDNEDELRVLENWLLHFGIKFHMAHCSGHVCKKDLIKTVKTINPKLLIPIHTHVPEDFKEFHDNVLIVEKEKKYEL